MKILLINKYLYPKGGAETYMLKIGEQFSRDGHEVEYFGMYDEANTVGNADQLYTYNMDFHSNGLDRFVYPFKILYSLEAKRKLIKIIRRFQPDLVHLNNINFQLTPSIIDAAYSMGVPIIQTVHDYQMICPNHLLFDPNTNTPCDKCITGSKWNCTRQKCIHGSRIKSFLGSIEGLMYHDGKTYSKVRLFICPSRFLEQRLQEVPLFREHTTVIHNFIELPERDEETMEKKGYVVYFGRLSSEKGIEMLLESCRRTPEIPYKIAGSGPMESQCTGIQNVEFVGFQTGSELAELIAGANFSVYPSIWHENCPLSVLESVSYGTPVLATNMGGMPELIDDGETGVILGENTVDALTEGIERLWHDTATMQRMSNACHAKRREMITIKRYCDDLVSLYEEVKIGSA